MFCKRCATPMHHNQEICPRCGTQAGRGHSYCAKCGNRLGHDVAMCVRCGTPNQPFAMPNQPQPQPMVMPAPQPRPAEMPYNNNINYNNYNNYNMNPNNVSYNVSDRLAGCNKTTIALMCFFFGSFGVHNFMMGENKKGIMKIICTLLCGIGVLLATIDYIRIITDGYIADSNKMF